MCERRGGVGPWSLPVSCAAALALLIVGCVGPDGGGPLEAIPPRADPAGVDTTTQIIDPQAPISDPEERRRLRWKAMWLAAGGSSPPGLPTALATARSERRAASLEIVREVLEGADSEAFRGALAELLEGDETRDEYWCAAARASARLSLYEFTGTLAANLDSPSRARRVAAREALFTSRGVWLVDTAAAGFHLAGGPPPTRAQLANIHAMTERLRDQAAVLHVLDHVRAIAGLSDPDPALRASAVSALADSLALPDPPDDFDSESVRGLLLGRLEEEEHPAVLHALIVGFLEHLGPADTCTQAGREFAGVLYARVPYVAGEDALMLAPLVNGLVRMPLDPALPLRGEDGVLDPCSLAYCAQVLIGDIDGAGEGGLFVGWMNPELLVDSDVLVSALRSLETFFERPLPDIPHSELREVLLQVIEDVDRDPAIRTGAVRVVAQAGRPEDLPRLGAALTEAPTGVAYELIATITKLVEGVEASTEPAIASRDALVAMLSRDETSLRRRALAMLATEPLKAIAETTDASLLLAVLEQDLAQEESETLLELLFERKDRALVDQLLNHSAFERLMAPNSGTSAILTRTLGELAKGDGPLTVEVARHLIEIPRSSEEALTEGVQRLRSALALIAALEKSAASQLDTNQHADVVRWSIELREASGSLAGVTTEEQSTSFLLRLTGLHLEECAPESELELWDHTKALLYADLIEALEIVRDDPMWLELTEKTWSFFQRAHEHARTATVDDGEDEWVILRDFARFLYAIDEREQALREYRLVFNRSSNESEDTSLLDLSDLRAAASVAVDVEPDLIPTALELSGALIGRENWEYESAGVRLGDLRVLVESVGGSELQRASMRLRFEGIPEAGFDPAEVVIPPDAIWRGLEVEPEGLEELREIAAGLDDPPPAPLEPDPDPDEESGEPESTGGEPETSTAEDSTSGS